MLKNLAKKLTNNLGLKVLAVLFAIALWIVVVNIDDPVKPAQYTISVTQDNMDYLTSNGKYSETLGGKNTVTFTASAKRSILEKLSNTDFTAVADMEKIEYVEGDGADYESGIVRRSLYLYCDPVCGSYDCTKQKLERERKYRAVPCGCQLWRWNADLHSHDPGDKYAGRHTVRMDQIRRGTWCTGICSVCNLLP